MRSVAALVRRATRQRSFRVVAGAFAAGAAAACLWAAPAGAAGTGYGPGGTAPPTAPGGFTTTVVSQTISTSGGTVTGTSGGAKLAVTVPGGTFSGPVQVTVSAAPTTSEAPGAVVAFDLTFLVNGTAPTGSFAHPVVFTVTDPSIKAGETVDVWNGSSWVRYQDATVTDGVATITLTTDPAFAVLASATVPGATTGVPIKGLGMGAGLLGLLGGAGLIATRRRRTAR